MASGNETPSSLSLHLSITKHGGFQLPAVHHHYTGRNSERNVVGGDLLVFMRGECTPDPVLLSLGSAGLASGVGTD
jgi:hypothetical protein